MTKSQSSKIEWLKQQAERSFNEYPTNVESCTLEMEVTESDCTDLVFLYLKKEAKPNTGWLFLCDVKLNICIGPSGGIKSATYIESKRSRSKTAYYVRKGVFSL